MKKDYKRRRFLMQELKAYEKITPMTEEERAILHEWVRAGHSVHENDAMAVYEGRLSTGLFGRISRTGRGPTDARFHDT